MSCYIGSKPSRGCKVGPEDAVTSPYEQTDAPGAERPLPDRLLTCPRV